MITKKFDGEMQKKIINSVNFVHGFSTNLNGNFTKTKCMIYMLTFVESPCLPVLFTDLNSNGSLLVCLVLSRDRKKLGRAF